MFGSDHMRERPHLDADVPRTLCLVGLIVVSMAFLWFGLMGLGLSFFVNQYIIVLFSTAAFVAVEVILTAGLRKTSSNHDAMLLAMELAILNLVLSFFSAAIIWN
jgi:hypothetical protein